MRFFSFPGADVIGALVLVLTFSWSPFMLTGQEDCNFLNGPEGLTAGCLDSCVWVVPDFERAAETTAYSVDSIDYAPPLDLGSGAELTSFTNGFSSNLDLPFGFSFFDNDVFALKVNRKGFITFSTGLTGTFNYPNQPLGSASLPSNSVMAPYAYISNSGGEVRTATLGEAPCRRFVVSWENLPQTGCSVNELVSQVVLHETSNAIEVHIGQFASCLQITAVVGIQGGFADEPYGPEEYDTGEFEIENKSFRYAPTGDTQTSLVYLIGDDIIGQGDSISVCIDESVEVVIGANFPEILPPPPVAGSCDAIPEDACDTSIVYNYNLGAIQTGSSSFDFDGELLGFSVTNNWTPSGGSWPGDMGLQLCDPSGNCGFIEGFNFNLNGTNLGEWPFNWNTTQGGFYESCFAVPGGLLEGDGAWDLTIQNGWTGSGGGVNFDGTVTLFYLCNLEPEEPDTSQFMAMDTVLIEFTFESQTADFALLDAEGNVLDVLCSEDDVVTLQPETPGGTWDASCVGCLQGQGEIDPAQVAPGTLEVSYTLFGDCGEVTVVQEVQSGLTPNVNTGNVGALCPFSDPVSILGTPAGGTWTADCGDCITTEGVFDPSLGTGEFVAEYTFGSVCTATESVDVNVGEAIAAELEDLAFCESIGAVQLDGDGLAGTWTADCGGCMLTSGSFTAPSPGFYQVNFLPGAGCGVETSASITVDQDQPIGTANVPEAICEDGAPLNLETDVAGGEWSATGAGLAGETFTPNLADLGTTVLTYTVENGSCTNAASFATEVLPILTVSLQEEDPFCVNNSGGSLNVDVDLDAEAVWSSVPPLVWSADCGDCINGSGFFDPGNAGVGAFTVTIAYNDPLGCSVTGSIEVEVAEAVDATIDEVPDLCESGSTLVLSAASNGGTWTANCGGCLSPAGSFNPGIGPGNYDVTYTITDVCTDIDAVQVTVVPQRDATILVDVPNDELCIGVEEWQLGSIWAGGVWSAISASGSPAVNAETGLLNLEASGVGEVTVTHVLEGLCGDSDTHILDILACSVELVNIFTPNGDGKNDRLIFKYIELYPDNRLTVYNRNGAVVFSAEGYKNEWDGDGASDGSHYFVLELPEGVEHASHLMIQR
jgi:gliding motility-associated-like protein